MVDFRRVAVLALVTLWSLASATAFQYSTTDGSFTIKDSDSACSSTTCVVYPVVCSELTYVAAASVTLDFATLKPSKLIINDKAETFSLVDSPVLANLPLAEAPVGLGKRGTIDKGLIPTPEPLPAEQIDRFAIEANPTFAPGECKTVATTITPVFGGSYKYSVFANGFELDPLVNATRYTIGLNTGSAWTLDMNASLSTVNVTNSGSAFQMSLA